MSTRSEILNSFKTVIESVDGIEKVDFATKVSYDSCPGYKTADFPLVLLVVTSENPRYLTSFSAMWILNLQIICYLLGDYEHSEIESLIKKIKDAIGQISELNTACSEVTIRNIVLNGESPLTFFYFNVEVHYEKGVKDA